MMSGQTLHFTDAFVYAFGEGMRQRGQQKSYEAAHEQARRRHEAARKAWEAAREPKVLRRCEQCGIFSLDPKTCVH